MNVFGKLYDYFQQHPKRLLWSTIGVTLLLVGLSSRIRFSEDIFDFLPKDADYTESLQVYSDLSEASRIVLIVEGQNTDSICYAIDAIGEALPMAITQVDIDGFLERLDFVYHHMPYFMADSDYVSLERRLNHDSITQIMATNRDIISTPGTSFLLPSIASDPLRIISLTKGAYGQYASAQSAFTSHDGYMMSKDEHLGFVFYDSPYSSTESAHNGELVDSLEQTMGQIMQNFPTVTIRLLGSPVVAVENARCIKRDSVLAILVSSILIILILLYSFPVKRDIGLAILPIVFGWLLGLAALGTFTPQVSIVVLGIGSVISGIAINYPLHLLIHQRYTTSVRQTLKEVISPLLVGNITTVGAFMALIPLPSVALRQLGIFASSNLIGTMLFCIVVLPHLMRIHTCQVREIHLPRWCTQWVSSPIKKVMPWLAGILLVAAIALPITHHYELFDPNLSHINYMTPQQRADFAFLNTAAQSGDSAVYLPNEAREELNRRVMLWNTFWQNHSADSVVLLIESAAQDNSIRPELFTPYCEFISSPYQAQDLQSTHMLAQLWPGRLNMAAMNSSVSNTISNHFNYLTTVCSFIVFIFLCICFRNVWLGLIAFLPMVLSWALIVALMQLFGLQFNIVNVILATFIFGQGDDYTIFVVEGLQYELRTGKKMVKLYQQSIILSAIIMLLSIGVLVFAKHPAMHSLGTVSLIGMSCVVVMAFVIPPVLFKMYKKAGVIYE